jgi:hypothetical protein
VLKTPRTGIFQDGTLCVYKIELDISLRTTKLSSVNEVTQIEFSMSITNEMVKPGTLVWAKNPSRGSAWWPGAFVSNSPNDLPSTGNAIKFFGPQSTVRVGVEHFERLLSC